MMRRRRSGRVRGVCVRAPTSNCCVVPSLKQVPNCRSCCNSSCSLEYAHDDDRSAKSPPFFQLHLRRFLFFSFQFPICLQLRVKLSKIFIIVATVISAQDNFLGEENCTSSSTSWVQRDVTGAPKCTRSV
jgi:hypothetical protein